ncbi:trypsin-like serine protease [Micromonospora sp.]|uniref:trypsin-like serine protease n=1 Tax=Micromonospora sp. TaxID=1876 RepID=UPI003B3A72F9
MRSPTQRLAPDPVMTGAPTVAGVPTDRVVSVVAVLSNGKFQVGSGYLITGRFVLTAGHCTRDKTAAASVDELRVFRASDGSPTSGVTVVAESPRATGLDLAVLRLGSAPWVEDLPAPVYARVDRSQSGVLHDCQALGYPLFQDAGHGDRQIAELHGVIYQAELAGTGRLVLREPLLETVTSPPDVDGTAWGGLSGAVVFHHGQALGVVIEHHPRQGASAVQLAAFDHLQQLIPHRADVAAVAAELGITTDRPLPVAAARPVAPLAGLVELVADGDLPRVEALDPYRLGASESNYGGQGRYGEADPYVPRTHNDVDQRLADALVQDRLVVVTGPSKAGKSRTAFEALRQRWAAAHIVAPQVGLAWNELAEHPRLRVSTDPLVIWLDDLHRFLIGADPLTLGRITALTDRPGPTVLLATLRTDRLSELRDSTGELGRDTRVLLDSGTIIELASTRHSDQEQAAARAAYPDQHLDSGLGEELAHAPQLLAKYRESRDAADPLRYLIVRCVVDWARVGHDRAISEPDLYALVRAMAWTERPDLDITDADLAEGVQWARTALPAAPTAALLITHPLPDKVRGYRPFDYLVASDNGPPGRSRSVPDDYWFHVLDHSSPNEAFAIGVAAYFRDAITASIRASQKAAAAGHVGAMFNLGVLLVDQDPPDLAGARRWYEKAAAAGHTGAMSNLGVLLAEQWDPPDVPGARGWYEKAAAAGHTGAMSNLGVLLARRLDPPDLAGARRWYEKAAAAAGHVGAMFNLGVLLAEQWDPPDVPGARGWFEKAADAGHTAAMFNLGVLLARRLYPPDLAGARRWYEKAAEAGDTDAMYNLGVLLADRLDPPDVPGARGWFEKAAEAGDTDAMIALGNLPATPAS